MPHSSGGGSHGGGSHGGHGGRGGSGSGPRISRTHFAGARRYSYYNRRGQQRFFYADHRFDPKFKPLRLLLAVIYLPFLLIPVMMLRDSLPIVPKNYDHSIIIEDDAAVINNRDGLYKELKRFMNKTGIAPSVVTVNNETWSDYSDLEDYAYDRYIQEFNDEMHWLIVYSEPAKPDHRFNDWYWEGMQGDDTDPVLTTENTNRFNSNLQSLLYEDKDFGTAAEVAFRDLTDNFTKSVNTSDFFTAIFWLCFIGFHAYFTLGLNLLKYRNAVPAPDVDSTGTYTGTATANQPTAYDYGRNSYSKPYSQAPTKRMDKNDMDDLFKTAKQMERKGSFNEKIECPYCGITY